MSDATRSLKGGRAYPVIGLTGPMCAGKNEAAAILEKIGYAVVDSDQTAHRALEDRRDAVFEAFEEIAGNRGIRLSKADGSIDRRALGSIVFSDPSLLARHESIVYPRINELLNAFIEDNPDRPVVINAPLLHKSPVLERCDFVVFVDAWWPIRLIRARTRDRLPFAQIFARFSAQKNLFSQYISKNVDIQRVHNRGSTGALERRLLKLLSNKGY